MWWIFIVSFIKDCHNGSFIIRHSENGEQIYYGIFHSLKEAEKYRDYCVDHDWQVYKKRLIRNLPKFISLTPNGSYVIRKTISGETKYFGSLHSLEDAVEERDKLIKCNWDYDLLVEME